MSPTAATMHSSTTRGISWSSTFKKHFVTERCLSASTSKTAHRQHSVSICAGKGFGSKVPEKKKKMTSKHDQIAEKTLKRMEASVHPDIDNEAASKGRVDVVQVESWGKDMDNDVDLGNLKVLKHGSQAAGPGGDDDSKPFYEQMVLTLQLMEARGELTPPRPKGTPPMPPFEKWSFGLQNYLQYLTDQYAVHKALESSVHSLLQTGSGPAHEALQQLSQLGLQRAECLADDLSALHAVDDTSYMSPSTHAASYAGYLRSIGARGGHDESSAEDKRQSECRLIAHMFTLQISHLTTIMRVGAKATEALDLFPKQAVNYYHTYPEMVKDPLQTFISGFNEAGRLLDSQGNRTEVKEQLANAMQKSSLLLVPLAVADES